MNALSVATNLKIDLKIAPVAHEAASYACKKWHYSGCAPAGKLIKMGVWEQQKFIGVVIFGRGANNNLGKPYGLEQTEICELVRIALRQHQTQVTRIVALRVRMVKKQNPGLKLIISYADPEQGHHGGIYQGGGWIYTGASQAQREVMHNGKVMHKRTANALFGTIKGMEKSAIMWKHKYLLPLTHEMSDKIKIMAKPYPKRVASSGIGTSGFQPERGGEIPTATLQCSTSNSVSR